MDSLFAQLSAVLGIAALVSIIMRLLRQPLIIGYILTGLLAGPSFLNIIKNHSDFAAFSQIGITLLLFIVGLGLNTSLIKSTGKPAFFVFLANLTMLVAIGLGLGKLFGFGTIESLLMGAGLVFSSTIVVIKTLVDNREQNRLHGRLIIGVLLVEDLAATALLIFLAAAKGGSDVGLVPLLAKGFSLAAGLILLGWFIFPRVAKFFAKSQEFLFGFALAWAFIVAFLFDSAGFSIEVGALFAGVSLAALPYAQEISTRLKPLRDFFLLLFFISMGEHLTLSGISAALLPALCCALVVTFIKPFSVANSLGILKYTKQTSFKVAAHLSQISEFSIVMIALAYSEGLVSTAVVNIVTLTTLITIATSAYLMEYDGAIFRRLQRVLPIFERKLVNTEPGKTPDYKMVLFGYRRGGHEFVRTFRSLKKPYVVVDYNPEIVETLENQHIPVIYGDATDYELLGEIGLRNVELVVSVMPGTSNNLELLHYLKLHNPDCIFICHANDYDDAAMYYDEGVTYVMLPHFIGSERMGGFIKKHGTNRKAFDLYRKQHLVSIGKAAIG
jgi:Kef-type K+ transport system membrane component KefB